MYGDHLLVRSSLKWMWMAGMQCCSGGTQSYSQSQDWSWIPLSVRVASMLRVLPLRFHVQLFACTFISQQRFRISQMVSSLGTQSLSSVSLSVLMTLMNWLFLVSLPMKYCWFFHQGMASGSPMSSRCRNLPCGTQNSSLPCELMKVRGSLVFSSNQLVMSVPAAWMMGQTSARCLLFWTRWVRSQTSSKKDTQISLGELWLWSSERMQYLRLWQGLGTSFFIWSVALYFDINYINHEESERV